MLFFLITDQSYLYLLQGKLACFLVFLSLVKQSIPGLYPVGMYIKFNQLLLWRKVRLVPLVQKALLPLRL